MKKRTVFSYVSIFMILSLIGCISGTGISKTFTLDGCTKIELMSGTTGKIIEITESETIEKIIQYFVAEPYQKAESSADRTGWSLRLKFYRNTVMIEDIIVVSKNTINYRGYFYRTKNDTIDYDYLNELIAEGK